MLSPVSSIKSSGKKQFGIDDKKKKWINLYYTSCTSAVLK
jgi:hypothetical protein